MNFQKRYNEIWFLVGSQHLYGKETLEKVQIQAKEICHYIDSKCHVKLVFKPVLTSSDDITRTIKEANYSEVCAGIVVWMHTFSPAKMWIQGLKRLQKPLLHFHTQYNAEIPWNRIDMNFMNLNQSAHGGREFGFIFTRLELNRKIIVGHWKKPGICERICNWMDLVVAWECFQKMKIARIGDNMREVAVTEGDKVSAQVKFGFTVNGYGPDDVEEHIKNVSDLSISDLVEEYYDSYIIEDDLKQGGRKNQSLYHAAQIELGLKSFLESGGFEAFTDTFENLGEIRQLPGIAVQRLMESGYGFGGEGDWKTAALVRFMKILGENRSGGASFMEDYTYNYGGEKSCVLGAHMLEVCPSISSEVPQCIIRPLGIGGKEDPVRLVFNGNSGSCVNVSLIDLGHRFRLIVNAIECLEVEDVLSNLPVARAYWEPKPNFQSATEAWILAGGAHHTCLSQNVSIDELRDFAELADIECLVIDNSLDINQFRQDMKINDVYYHLNSKHY